MRLCCGTACSPRRERRPKSSINSARPCTRSRRIRAFAKYSPSKGRRRLKAPRPASRLPWPPKSKNGASSSSSRARRSTKAIARVGCRMGCHADSHADSRPDAKQHVGRGRIFPYSLHSTFPVFYTMKPLLLVLVFLSDEHRDLVSESFEMIYAPNENLGADRTNGTAQIAARGQDIRVVLTNGTNGLLASEIAALPKLELICTLGVGHENVDLAAATARGIPVCNAAGT